jgi:hypothetical protein
MAVGFVALLTAINLRGVRETGLAFAAPTYAFVVAVVMTIVAGAAECLNGCPHAAVPDPKPIGPAGAAIGALVVPTRVRVGIDGADRDRGDLQRRRRVPGAKGSQRSPVRRSTRCSC